MMESLKEPASREESSDMLTAFRLGGRGGGGGEGGGGGGGGRGGGGRGSTELGNRIHGL